ncbi:MAG: long-chain-acyl-CoA synthetase [Erythrobacter sp.]|uniref:long-chain-acyl-CoA synthetase n=1 Tax=Erythrobacter sp. TaxID=1042 RepID=UPI00262B0ABB|nr:long-chain-acyl-CoA synthetase [Erythrobacter sp.]MDJ0979220.1 long-chain-acyl-CoA synthetase [Erythrobacter sp.]
MLQFLRKAQREFTYAKGVYGVLSKVKELQPESRVTLTDEIEAAVDAHADRVAFLFEGETLTYREFDARANAVAHWALSQGLKPGDTVALVLENSPDYPAVWYGLSKVGVVAALINTNLEGDGLAHCVSIVEAKAIIAGGVQASRARDVAASLTNRLPVWDFDGEAGEDMAAALAGQPTARPDASIRAAIRNCDTMLFAYTSGTTGLPKAARITHMRVRGMARFADFLGSVGPGDRVYNTLPLYHMTGGALGLAGPLIYGATVILKRKLSVSHFWDDVADYGANKFVYIGELCRYLLNAPPHPRERAHALECGFGNGLRGEVWGPFVERFGVGAMREFYGSTEGNVSFMNLDGKVGAIGRLPGWIEDRIGVKIVKFDVIEEKPVRGEDGFCQIVDVDEPGEALGRIGTSGRDAFHGYHDKAATQKKILTDVFEKGDAWFRTGDLVRRDADGYVYFVDRIGDTYRWKGENVATNEVSDVISKYPGVETANAYGVAVPGADGRAGMVAMTVREGFDMAGFAAHCRANLPPYAVPLFVRIQPQAETTGTFKFRKVELVEEGFDLSRIEDPIWFLEPGADAYVRMGAGHQDRLAAGEYRL